MILAKVYNHFDPCLLEPLNSSWVLVWKSISSLYSVYCRKLNTAEFAVFKFPPFLCPSPCSMKVHLEVTLPIILLEEPQRVNVDLSYMAVVGAVR